MFVAVTPANAATLLLPAPPAPKGLLGPASPTDCGRLLTDAVPTEWVKKMIREGKADDPQVKRLREVVQRSGFAAVALNQQIIRAHNEKYTTELDQGVPTNQKQSGRCWIFAGLNMIRSQLLAEGKVPAGFEFSENYLHFFNMLEKSNRYLEAVIEKTYKANKAVAKLSKGGLKSLFEPQLGDGGWYEYFMFLVSKYGLAPKDAMPETKSSEATALMITELKRHLAGTAHEMLGYAGETMVRVKAGEKLKIEEYLEKMREIKERGMTGVWRVLATHLGDPPAEFEYREDGKRERQGAGPWVKPTKTTHYTPQEFATSFVKFDPQDYVVIAASPMRKPGQVYEVKGSAIGPAEKGKPSYDVRFLNVSTERMEELAVSAIEGGQPVWFAADMSRDVDHSTGIMHPGIYERDSIYDHPESQRMAPLGNRKLRSFYGLTSPNHAMVLTGFDRPDPSKPVVKFKNENSWGDGVGSKGTYHLYREWFHENVFQVIVHKKFLNEGELKLWEAPKVGKIGEHEELF
jgi:bleomycin hydrolase